MDWEKRLIMFLSLLLVIASSINAIILLELVGGATATTSLCLVKLPTFNNLTNQSTQHSFEFTYQINYTDGNNGTIVFSDNTSLFNINSTGFINFTPSFGQVGNESVLISLQSTLALCQAISTTKNIFMEVFNVPPTLNATIPNQTWEQDVTLTGLDLDSYFSDPEGGTLFYGARSGNNVTVTVNNDNSSSNKGVVTFKPDKGWSGISWVIFVANDSLSNITSNNVTLNVTPVANFCGDNICREGESCSTCQADCGVCPAGGGSSGGGSSGGSGSGASTKPSYKPKDSTLITKEPIRVTKEKEAVINFNFTYESQADVDFVSTEAKLRITNLPNNVGDHSVRFSKVDVIKKEVTFIFESEPKSAVVKEGESKFVDLNDDGHNDIEVTVYKIISQNEVSSNIRILPPPPPPPQICHTNWECTIWIPEVCPMNESQTRTCYDLNDCSKPFVHPLERSCSYVGPEVQEVSSEILDIWPYVLIIVIVLILLFLSGAIKVYVVYKLLLFKLRKLERLLLRKSQTDHQKLISNIKSHYEKIHGKHKEEIYTKHKRLLRKLKLI
jgi:uncharacterized membrane protein YgcG